MDDKYNNNMKDCIKNNLIDKNIDNNKSYIIKNKKHFKQFKFDKNIVIISNYVVKSSL